MDPITLVTSDAHLGEVSAENEAAFHAFLRHAAGAAGELLINGDLFDFWFEYRSVVLRRHFMTLRLLADLVDAGVRVRLVGGNHDAWGGPFLTEEIGMELIQGPVVTSVGGRLAYLAHGDGLAEGDWGYRGLKRVIRSRGARKLFRLVHPDLATRLVRRVSRTQERRADGPRDDLRRAELLSSHAEAILEERPELELVIFGHAHRPELREIAPGRHYLNPGDWIHHCSYAVVSPERIELKRWNPR
ncbi:MAG: UDP-2,3-diacylglucosamine diphosphatase [Gemmatimonadota bacterium]